MSEVIGKAVKSGTSGASAMVVQVSSLMWLRTTMNYQYKNGGNFLGAFRELYGQGGMVRFYRGYMPALMIGPLSRFGDTAMNELVLVGLEGRDIPIFMKTGVASVMAGLWRVGMVPIDTWKTTKQVYGKDGMEILRGKMRVNGFGTLYQGAMASSLATMVGHYPWFLTYNYLNEILPKYSYRDDVMRALGRNAMIGFCASAMSDTVSNSVRVLKTVKQTSEERIGYGDAFRQVVRKDGIRGLMFRGLETKIMTNGLQGIVFSVVWRYLSENL